jgi:guanosine-3',5'-bis(diphosphate) 3'-pyrophosphohydrolase
MPLATTSLDESTARYITKVREVNPRIPVDVIEKAYRFSWTAHKDQWRKSGDPFLAHPVAVSLILAEQQLDSVTIAAGLLHDVLEDTAITRENLAAEFGEEITLLVDGVTKIKALQMHSRQERQAESFRKMLLSMSQDLRVIIIKFADRLHNLRTLDYLAPERIKEIAAETLDIYAPLAHRLGMARIKWELEDLAFKHLYGEEYKTIVSKVVADRNDRMDIIDSFTVPLKAGLAEEGLDAAVVGRPKHFYSIYRKMVQRNKSFEEIYDLLAIRIITKTTRDCYLVLGIIHSIWKPIQDRFKDYIATPKSNGYQSLHTTVVGHEGHIVEMQIRTWEMNQIAEDGIAAHWLYKIGDERKLTQDDKALAWLKNLIEWQKDLTDSNEFLEFFKIDLFHAEIFVFTPKGDLITLPKGATVLDFAFAVHTELGLHCIGARVDGKIEPINKPLSSGTTVEILHLSSKTPSVYWLGEVKTPKARSSIRHWLKNTGRQESIDLGEKIIKTGLKKINFAITFADHVPMLLQFLGINSLDRLYELVGAGSIPIRRVMQYFEVGKIKRVNEPNVVSRLVRTITGRNHEVLIGDSDDLMVRFARCCNPVPGDSIIGFLTKGRGISVHRDDCENTTLFKDDKDRMIKVSWEEKAGKRYLVVLEIVASNQREIIQHILKVFGDTGAELLDGVFQNDHGQVRGTFKITINNAKQVKQILRSIQHLKGVESVVRSRDSTEVG